MNNVWTSIACKAPCAARQVSRKPLLRLFNGYARSIAGQHGRSVARGDTVRSTLPKVQSNGFTTSCILSAKGRKAGMKAPKSKPTPPSKPQSSTLQAADRGLSHAGMVDDASTSSHALTLEDAQESLTWRDYDPTGGMPLPSGELDQPNINKLFGSEGLDADTGNYILSVMYWRRQSGALIDEGLDFPSNSGVTREQALQGLEYIRALEPEFDEEAAGQTWANEETLRLQETLRDRAVKIGLYKPEEADDVGAEAGGIAEQSDQGTDYGRERNRDSQLMKLRQENIRKQEQEVKEREAKQAVDELAAINKHRGPLELGGGVQPPTGIVKYTPHGIDVRPKLNTWIQPVERKDWVKKYEKEAEIYADGKLPELSLVQYLGPSFAFMLLVLSLAYYTSENYTPPPQSARMYPDTPPAVVTVAALTGALAAGFFLARLPPLWKITNKYFTIVPAYPSPVSIVGAAFRHQPLSHLLTNGISLIFFGLSLHEDVGRGTFLAVFFASGAVGGFSALAYNVLRKNFTTYIFGSSSCVLGVAAAAIVVRPERKLKVAGYEVPIAMWLLLAGYGTLQVVAAARGLMPGIDHAGHIGGIITGIMSAAWIRRKARMEREAKEQIEPQEGKGFAWGIRRAILGKPGTKTVEDGVEGEAKEAEG